MNCITGRDKCYCKFCKPNYNKVKISERETSEFIYVIINDAWDGWVKVGRAKNVDKRLSSYQTGSPLRDYKLQFSFKPTNIRVTEYAFYYNYGDASNEWFNISTEKAIKLINEVEENFEYYKNIYLQTWKTQ